MTDSISYNVIENFDDVEVRLYPGIVLAMVCGLPDNEAFGILFRYISGQNWTHRSIDMTVPVISSEPYSKKIPMARPVLSDKGSFSFVMPPSNQRIDVPEPLDDRVLLVEIGPRKLAVLRFSGRIRDGLVGEMEERSFEALRKKGIEPKGEAFLMRYNGPGTPEFLRRNEVAVKIGGEA